MGVKRTAPSSPFPLPPQRGEGGYSAKSPSPLVCEAAEGREGDLGGEGSHFPKFALLTLLALLLTACAPQAVPPTQRIALIVPFEGRFREVGYDALYPLKLALADADSELILMSVDDGGTPESAVVQARRAAADPTVLVAVVVGPNAAHPDVLAALGDLPTVVIGLWGAQPSESVFVLASEKLPGLWTTDTLNLNAAIDTTAPATGGELFALKQYPRLRPDADGITAALSAAPADDAFAERLVASALFVPAPGALATIAYDAGGLIHTVISPTATRQTVRDALANVEYDGLNGRIAFTADGWWEDAPMFDYTYADGVLTSSPAP